MYIIQINMHKSFIQIQTKQHLEIRKQMPSAYVLFNVSPGFESQVLAEAKKTGAIVEAYVSYGVYDLIVKATAPSMSELRELVTFKLRSLPNVTSTLTLMMDNPKEKLESICLV